MIDDELGKQLHVKATLGEPMTEEEKASLEAWYAKQDAEERALLEKNYETFSIDELQKQIKEDWAQIVASAQHIQELTSQNEAIKKENARLQELLAKRLETKAV